MIVTNLFPKSSFEKLLKLQEVIHCSALTTTSLTIEQKPSMVTNKLEFVISRLNRLEDASLNEIKHERWAKLFEWVARIDSSTVTLMPLQ